MKLLARFFVCPRWRRLFTVWWVPTRDTIITQRTLRRQIRARVPICIRMPNTIFAICISIFKFPFFPEDTPLESGGTLLCRGTQFRRVHEAEIKRYQNIIGQVQAVCEAGTMFFWHTNIWHSARSNFTDRDRYMFKLRLNPRFANSACGIRMISIVPRLNKHSIRRFPGMGNAIALNL